MPSSVNVLVHTVVIPKRKKLELSNILELPTWTDLEFRAIVDGCEHEEQIIGLFLLGVRR